MNDIEELQQLLSLAAGKIGASKRHRAAVNTVRTVLPAMIATIGAGVIVLLIGKALGHRSLAPTCVLILTGCFGSGIFTVVKFWRAFRGKPSWSEVAERLDLAAADHNAIASALDFARLDPVTPMASWAIAGGIVIAKKHALMTPTTVEHRSWPLRSAGVFVATAGVFIIACLCPVPTVRSTLHVASSGPETMVLRSKLGIAASSLVETSHGVQSSSPSNVATAAHTAAASPDSAGSYTIAFNAGGDASAAQSAATASKPSASRSAPMRPFNSRSTKDDPRRPAARSTSNQSMQTALGQGDSPDQSTGNGVANGAAAESDSSSNPTQDILDQHDEPNAASSDGMGLLPDDKTKSDTGAGDGGGNTKMSDTRGSGKGTNEQSGDQSGPNGSSSGQNAPKKSRGVAPLMLGSRQGDLVKGRPLPGPDQRTPIQMPPVPMPADPAVNVTADSTRIPEPATHVLHVSSAERTTVDAYFQSLHADSPAD